MPGTVELLVWSREKKILDPALDAIIWGGNVGHAAVRMIIPQNEVNRADIQSLKQSGIPVTDTTQYYKTADNKRGSVPSYEIYFSFWPGDDTRLSNEKKGSSSTSIGSRRELLTHQKDRTYERAGEKLSETSHGLLQKFFNEDEIRKMYTIQNTGILTFIRDQISENRVFSGINSIVHLSKEQLDALCDRLKKNIVIPRDVQTALDNREFNEENLAVIINLMLKKADQLTKKSDLTIQEQIKLDEIKKDIDLLNQNIFLGVNPDYNISFRTGGSIGLDPKRIIDGMCDIAREKKYGLCGWNCSSTALYVLLQGFDPDTAPSMSREVQNLKKMLDIEKVTPPLITPDKAKDIAAKLQTAIYQVQDRENDTANRKKSFIKNIYRGATLFNRMRGTDPAEKESLLPARKKKI